MAAQTLKVGGIAVFSIGLLLLAGCGDGSKKPVKASPPESVAKNDDKTGPAPTAEIRKIQPKAKFKLPGEFYGHNIKLSKDGKRLALVYRTPKYDTFVQIWDMSADTPKVIGEFPGTSFDLSPSGKLLLSLNGYTASVVHEIEPKKKLADIPTSFSFACFRDDNTVALTTRSHNFPQHAKGKITLWDIAKNADAGSFEIPDDRFTIALPAKDGKEFWLFMSNKKFEVECYDLVAKKLARTIRPESDDPPRPYSDAGIYQAIAPDSSVFASACRKTCIFDATGKIVGGLPEHLWSSPIGFLPGDNRYITLPREEKDGSHAGGLDKGDLVIVDWKTSKIVAALRCNTKESLYGASSADGSRFVSMTASGEGLVFDLAQKK